MVRVLSCHVPSCNLAIPESSHLTLVIIPLTLSIYFKLRSKDTQISKWICVWCVCVCVLGCGTLTSYILIEPTKLPRDPMWMDAAAFEMSMGWFWVLPNIHELQGEAITHDLDLKHWKVVHEFVLGRRKRNAEKYSPSKVTGVLKH
jgi:hypothetical protein